MKQESPIQLPAVKKTNRQDELAPLIGLPLRRIGREGKRLQAHFGKLQEIFADGGKMEPIGEWILEVYGECPWRISQPGRIVVAAGDFDCSPLGDDRNPYDGSCSTRFDLMANFIHNEFATKPAVVKSIEMDGVEGFTMRLSGDYTLVVFPADSEIEIDPRYWRVVQPMDDKPMKRGLGSWFSTFKSSERP
jgi:hypothetical protein